MRRARWIPPWKDSLTNPLIFHCISRVVDRRFAFGSEEKEHFRMLMRMIENHSGAKILSYALMCNHVHILLEIPPMPVGGLSDEELLKRLGFLYAEATISGVATRLEAVRNSDGSDEQKTKWRAEIHKQYTYRMHDLGEFMKSLLQRFTQWFNKQHRRTGTLWEQRFKSVIVESGTATRMMAAYIDLNPVRAGMVKNPEDYRWSSYGEAIGGGAKGIGKKTRTVLVRAVLAGEGVGFDPNKWKKASAIYRELMGMALERKAGRRQITEGDEALPELKMAGMLICRIRHFSDGAILGGKEFVNQAFAASRERFSTKRKDGARKMSGTAKEAGNEAGNQLWTVRDLRVRVE